MPGTLLVLEPSLLLNEWLSLDCIEKTCSISKYLRVDVPIYHLATYIIYLSICLLLYSSICRLSLSLWVWGPPIFLP